MLNNHQTTRAPNKAGKNAERGSFLLEALIGILIFAAGIIALIGLQAASIRSASDARYRTEAAFFANTLLSRMWVEDKASLATLFAGSAGTGGAKYNEWYGELIAAGNGLPGVVANPPVVTVDAATSVVTVILRWQAPGDLGGSHQYLTTSQIR